jgi:hypothetical protein
LRTGRLATCPFLLYDVRLLSFEQRPAGSIRARTREVIAGLPRLQGTVIRIGFQARVRDRRRPADQIHAGSLIRERRIIFDRELLADPEEYGRVLVHEIFHFAWVRAGNESRSSYERVVAGEMARKVPGELGWSAEWRKGALKPGDRTRRSRFWREYVCESFCDTAAWLYAGADAHPEFLLPPGARRARRNWFEAIVLNRGIRL